MTSQQTSIPYSGDVLKPHDQNLIWVREFGTETTEDVGDSFTSTVATTPVDASINARLAMLELNSVEEDVDELEEPRGRTFLLPEWDSFKSPPFFAEIDPTFKAVVLIAHVLFREETIEEEAEQAAASLVFGGENLVGDAQDVPMVTCTILQSSYANPPAVRVRNQVSIEEWLTGGMGGADDVGSMESMGNSVYFRVLLLGSSVKSTQLSVAAGGDGVMWSFLAEAQLGDAGPDRVLRRVGLSSRGACIASMDWLRLYNYPITGISENGSFIPSPPVTGGRLFIP